MAALVAVYQSSYTSGMRASALGRTAAVLFAFLPGIGAPALRAAKVAVDMQELRKIATWSVSEPSWENQANAPPDSVCGIERLDGYTTQRMDHNVASKLSDRAATSQITGLDRRVVAFLEKRGWSKMNVGAQKGGIPNLKRCYRKQDAIVQIYMTTGRCTMSSPCNAYDGFAVIFYLPRREN